MCIQVRPEEMDTTKDTEDGPFTNELSVSFEFYVEPVMFSFDGILVRRENCIREIMENVSVHSDLPKFEQEEREFEVFNPMLPSCYPSEDLHTSSRFVQ